MRKCCQLMQVILLLITLCIFIACESDILSANKSSIVDDMALKGFEINDVDSVSRVISVRPKGKMLDSLYFDNLNIPKASFAYLAMKGDLLDPEIDWENPIKQGKGVAFDDDWSVVIVILDESSRVSEVWKIKVTEGFSSSAKSKSSSSSKENSSNSKIESSSENKQNSPSSEHESSDSISSSIEKIESSSSIINTSSSITEISSGNIPISSLATNDESSSSQGKSSENNSSSSENPKVSDVESSSSKVKSSSSQESSSSSYKESSSSQIMQKSSKKELEEIVFVINGSSLSNIKVNSIDNVIDLGVIDEKYLNAIQVNNIHVSEGAIFNVPIKQNLTLQTSFEEETLLEIKTKYECNFTITAEDGSFDTWAIVVSVTKKNGTLLSDFGVATRDSSIKVSENNIYVEVPYGTDLTHITILPLDSVVDLSSGIEMDFIDEGVKKTYTIKAGMQLPGSDFNEWDRTFWGSSSDVMAKEGVSKGCALVLDVSVKSKANLEFFESKAELTTRLIEASSIGIDGGWKAAGGFYFTGEFMGDNALELYEEGRTIGCPVENAVVDMTKMMNFGKPFMGRPLSFDVDYSYIHNESKNYIYPQKSLIYVMLVSNDGKLVASGAIMDSESLENVSKNVELVYGGDPFELLSGGYPIAQGIEVGTGNESVATIHVMFASSAYAHVVAGGIAGNSNEYRGGENSKLILEKFKLNY